MTKERIVSIYSRVLTYKDKKKKKKNMSFSGKWMELQSLKLNEISQMQKERYVFSHMPQNKTNKNKKTTFKYGRYHWELEGG